VRWRSGFLEEKQVRGRALDGVVDGRRLFDVLAAVDGAVGGARVDAGEVDVGVDGAEDETEEAQYQHGDHAAGDERLASPVLSAARCRRCRRIVFRHFIHRRPNRRRLYSQTTTA